MSSSSPSSRGPRSPRSLGRGTGRGKVRPKLRTSARGSGPPRKKPPVLPDDFGSSNNSPELSQPLMRGSTRTRPLTPPALSRRPVSTGGGSRSISPGTKQLPMPPPKRPSRPPRRQAPSRTSALLPARDVEDFSDSESTEELARKPAMRVTRDFVPSESYGEDSSTDELVPHPLQAKVSEYPPGVDPAFAAVAKEDYDAENHRELSLKAGSRVIILFYNKSLSWAKGYSLETGTQGFFPREVVAPQFTGDYPAQSAAGSNSSLNPADRKRQQLVSNILTSEKAYVRDLGLLESVFMNELPLVSRSSVFSNLAVLLKEHRALLIIFERKARTEEPVGDVFKSMAELFEKHGVVFMLNEARAICKVEEELESNAEFASALAAAHQRQECRNIRLHEFLSKPSKRVRELQQLINVLLQRTDEGDVDYAELCAAQRIIDRVKAKVDGVQDTVDNLLKLVELQNKVSGLGSLVAEESRRFHGEYTVVEAKGHKREKRLYLLSDMIVTSTIKRGSLGKGTKYMLNSVTINNTSECVELQTRREKKRFTFNTIEERELFVAEALKLQSVLPPAPVPALARGSVRDTSEARQDPAKTRLLSRFKAGRSPSIEAGESSPSLSSLTGKSQRTRSPRGNVLSKSMSRSGITRNSDPVIQDFSSSSDCQLCKKPAVTGDALDIKGKRYHIDCYKCTSCSMSLVKQPFAERKGVLYCKSCAISMFAEPCGSCGKMITGQFLSAFDSKYHPACFVCHSCGTNIAKGFAKKGGHAYCRECVRLVK